MVVATTGTRLKILNLLQEKGEASVGQLAVDLYLASATVRRHLDVLQRDRLVDYHQVRKTLGRPEYTYSLTEEGQESLPKHYPQLLVALLNELSNLTREEISGFDGKGLSNLLFGKMAALFITSSASDDDEVRLSSLIQVLSEGDFMPEVEKLGNAIRIHLHNCPFRSVALQHEVVCHVDRDIISNLLQVPVEQEHCIRNGDRSCGYVASLQN